MALANLHLRRRRDSTQLKCWVKSHSSCELAIKMHFSMRPSRRPKSRPSYVSCLFVRLSICSMMFMLTRKQKSIKKTKIGLNVSFPSGRSSRCVNYCFKGSKAKVTGCKKTHARDLHWLTLCTLNTHLLTYLLTNTARYTDRRSHSVREPQTRYLGLRVAIDIVIGKRRILTTPLYI